MARFLTDQTALTCTGHEVEVSDSFKLFRATMVDIFYSQWQKTGCLERANRAYEDAMSNKSRESLFRTDKDVVLKSGSGSVQCSMNIHRIHIGNCFLFKHEGRCFHAFFLKPTPGSWYMQSTKNGADSSDDICTVSIWSYSQAPVTLHFQSRADAWEVMCFMFSRKTLVEVDSFNGVRSGPFICPSVFSSPIVAGGILLNDVWNPCTIFVDRIGCYLCCALKLHNGLSLEFLLSDQYGRWGYQYQAVSSVECPEEMHFVTFFDFVLDVPFCDLVFDSESDVGVLFNLLLQ